MERSLTSPFAKRSIGSWREWSRASGPRALPPDEARGLAAALPGPHGRPRRRMRAAHPLLLGSVRRADLSFLRGARRGPPGDAGGEAGSGLSEGPLREQARAARIPRASRLPLLSAGQARPGAAGARDGEGAVPRVGRVHRPVAGQSEEELTGCGGAAPALRHAAAVSVAGLW